MIREKSYIIDILLIACVSAVSFLLFLGATPLFDWDEINFAESAREMLMTGNYFQVQVNYEPFWEKPPLFFWLQALCMRIFGVGEYAARMPSAIIGVCTLLALYSYGRRYKGQLFGRILVCIYLGTTLPFIYFKSGIIDPTFNFFIFLGLMQMFQYEWLQTEEEADADKGKELPWIAGFWIGLATLTKGPVALLVSLLIYGLYKIIFDGFRIPWLAALKFIAAWAIIVIGWYGIETLIHGTWFISEFIKYQIELFSKPVAGHGQPFYYHFVVFVLGCFPMAAFAFRGMFLKDLSESDSLLWKFMLVWFWVIMILFSLVTTKIVHYASLLYFPAAFLSALYIKKLIQTEQKPHIDVYVLLGIGLLIWGFVPSFLNLIESNLDLISREMANPLIAASMRLKVAWSGWEWLVGALFLVGCILNISLNLSSKQYLRFWVIQAICMIFLVNAAYKTILPKVARYTQGAPQDFFSDLAGKDVYVTTAKYKTYLPYFYAKVQPYTHPRIHKTHWLDLGDIDKDVYMAVPKHMIDKVFKVHYKHFERLYEEGGYVFFRRKAPNSIQTETIGALTP